VLCLAYWLVAIPLGFWLGLVRAADPLAGTVSIWQSLIAGIALTSLLVFRRLAIRLREPLPPALASFPRRNPPGRRAHPGAGSGGDSHPPG